MTSTRYFPSFAGHQCPPGAWWHQLQFWWAYIGGRRLQIILLSKWHKVACRLCKWEKAGDHGQCLGGRQKLLYIVFTFEDYFLGETGEKVCNPRQNITSHSRVVEFQEKTSVGNFIEGLWEVQRYGIYLLVLINVGCKVLYSENVFFGIHVVSLRGNCDVQDGWWWLSEGCVPEFYIRWKLVRWAGSLLVDLYPLFWKLELLWPVSSQMEFVLDLMMLGIWRWWVERFLC